MCRRAQYLRHCASLYNCPTNDRVCVWFFNEFVILSCVYLQQYTSPRTIVVPQGLASTERDRCNSTRHKSRIRRRNIHERERDLEVAIFPKRLFEFITIAFRSVTLTTTVITATGSQWNNSKSMLNYWMTRGKITDKILKSRNKFSRTTTNVRRNFIIALWDSNNSISSNKFSSNRCSSSLFWDLWL